LKEGRLDNQSQVNCPGCGAAVADGEAICPKCDYIIDASFLSGEAPAQGPGPDEETAPPNRAPPRPSSPKVGSVPARPSAKHRPPAPAGSTGSGVRASGKTGKVTARTAPAAGAADGSTQIKSMEQLEQSRTKRPPPPKETGSRRSMPDAPGRRVRTPPPKNAGDWKVRDSGHAPMSPTTSGYGIVAPEDALAEAKNFIGILPTSDKLAFAGVALNVLFSFFPWKETVTEGEVLGLMSLGFPVFVVSILAMFTIVIRVRRFMPKLNPLVPWLLQLGAVCFCIVWCLVFVKLSWDGRLARSPVGNFEMRISTPSFGVFVSLVTSLLGLGGTLMGLKEKPS
jgi:hypothetical protein